MYLEEIEIKNYGCIENFKYKFRKDKDNNPIPLVIVGKNGTGKTLLISNLIDSVVEIKRELYPNGILEVNTNNYFRIGSLNYINNNSHTSEVRFKFDINNKNVSYIDIMSLDPKKALNEGVQENDLVNKDTFIKTRFSKKLVMNKTDSDDFEKGIALYFPSDRFYRPMWYNRENYNRINYDINNNVGKSRSNIIKIDILENLYDWLIDCFMEHQFVPFSFINNGERMFVNALSETMIQKNIKDIFNIIKNDNCNYTLPNRKNKRFKVTGKNFNLNDISQLSTGEIYSFGLALSILKEWDLYHNDFKLEEIEGCVIIDEIDIGLHVDYCYRVIPALMKLFPKVQFVITTHSPFLLSGLKNEFKENIDIVNMPKGELLNDINAFSEMKNAYDIFEIETSEMIKKNKELQNENERLKNIDNKIIIYTEGKTDVKYLKIALEKLDGYDEIKSRIEYYDIEHALRTGDGELEKIYTYLQVGNDNNIKICMFDRDNIKYIISERYIKAENKVYKFNIPIPSNRNDNDRISIEHYLKDEELKTLDPSGKRMFFANEFSIIGDHIETQQLICQYVMNNHNKNEFHPLLIIDGNDDKKVFKIGENGAVNYALSKNQFVTNIENGVNGFNEFDFSEFKKIFDIIEEIRQNEDI